MSTKISNFRLYAYRMQEGRCTWCAEPMWEARLEAVADFTTRTGLVARDPSLLLCTADHYLPLHDGGRTTRTNIVAAHRWCNEYRHYGARRKSVEAYRAMIERQIDSGHWHHWVLTQRPKSAR